MDFYCCLAGSEFVGDLLIEQSGNHESHNLPLSCGQIVIAFLQFVHLGLLLSRGAVTLEGLLNRVQEILVPERFRQKFHGTRLQRLDRHRNVAMGRNEDDGNLHADLRQVALEIESTQLRQSYVENQTTGATGELLPKKVLTSRKKPPRGGQLILRDPGSPDAGRGHRRQ